MKRCLPPPPCGISIVAMDLGCGNCGAALRVEAHQRTTVCPYCAVAAVVERPPSEAAPNPAFIVPFSHAEARAKAGVKDWLLARSFFVPSQVRRATISSMRGVYVPSYLYSAVASSEYSAEIGENYTETETYTTTDGKGNTVVRTRNVVRTEWRPLRGKHSTYLLDVLVTASRGIPNDELEAAEPFDFRDLRRYSPALISGWIAEDSTLQPEHCLGLARQETQALVHRQLTKLMPGDSQRNLQFNIRLERETQDLILVPLWVIAAKWHSEKPPLHILVNGQSGQVAGKLPISWLKVVLAVLLFVAVLVGAILAISIMNPGGR